MSGTFKQLVDVWAKLKFGQKISLVVAVLATIGVIGAIVMYSSQPEYSVLFSDLKPADAQSIVEKLKTQNVQYQLSNNGTVVSVPAERVAELRLLMASSGTLAGGHVGFDIFDRTSFGATEFTQQVNYQRAIEGELARTLEAMDEVDSVRVHITQPHDSIYADKAERAKGSVMLRMKQGKALSRERTEAVVSLVASAVEGLDPADVAVMDTQGRLLSNSAHADNSKMGDASVFSSHLEASRKFESETAARIVTLLEPLSGIGRVRADVAANLDFSQTEQTQETYDPRSQVIRSQQSTQEVRNGNANSTQTGGVSGVRGNDPTTRTPATTTTPNGDQRAATTTNYEINKTVTHTVGAGGKISRLSVSVVVDFKNVNGTMVTRSPEELKKMQDLVAAAVGIDENRGDQIVVQTIPFDQPTVEIHNPTWLEKHSDLVRTGIKYGALAIATLLLLIFVVRPAKRGLRTAFANRELGPGTMPMLALPSGNPNLTNASPRTVAELQADMDGQIVRNLPDPTRANALRKQLIDRTRQEPENVAMTVRGWLQEGAK
jgi:flagellar M-ring protein FliF